MGEVGKTIMDNCRINVREVADSIDVSIGSSYVIFSDDLDLRLVAAKFIPISMQFEQKLRQVEVDQELLN